MQKNHFLLLSHSAFRVLNSEAFHNSGSSREPMIEEGYTARVSRSGVFRRSSFVVAGNNGIDLHIPPIFPELRGRPGFARRAASEGGIGPGGSPHSAAEVVQAYSPAQTAEGRIGQAEAELKDARMLVREDLAALGQTQRLGEGGPIQLVVRPLEVVASIQMLHQAYIDYYSSIADFNRAQFQLYRALGQSAQAVLDQAGPAGCAAPAELPPHPHP